MTSRDKPPVRIFYPDTRFERLARRSGGTPREIAVSQAQEEIDELKESFGDWLSQQMSLLQNAAIELESDAANERARAEAERLCSDIRDIGTTMGYELLTFVAESLCAVLDAFKQGAAYDRDVVACHLDALLLAASHPYRGLRTDQVPDMAEGLQRVARLASKMRGQLD